jgi:hypothetical protein
MTTREVCTLHGKRGSRTSAWTIHGSRKWKMETNLPDPFALFHTEMLPQGCGAVNTRVETVRVSFCQTWHSSSTPKYRPAMINDHSSATYGRALAPEKGLQLGRSNGGDGHRVYPQKLRIAWCACLCPVLWKQKRREFRGHGSRLSLITWFLR